MKMPTNGIIPMDRAIRDFDYHLKSHPRTILSAKYGDGKSYFLSAAEKKLKSKYVFLKLYPVNYQVEENQGVFEYIKRDLLFQMYGQGMVPDSYVIPDSVASYFFLQRNWDEFAKETLQCLTFLDASNTTKATLGALKFLSSMRKKYDDYKDFRDNGGQEGILLDRFLSAFDKKGIYEADPITAILSGIVNTWKKNNPKKRICLIFEDMDRIDPAHIFRILNVVSAHMDYGYQHGVSSASQSLTKNKFGVDNIVVCLDYDNLHSIYRHFYGPQACFEGYIGKFSDKGIFQYSIKALALRYYINQLIPITGIDEKALSFILAQIDLLSFSLRQVFHAIEDAETQFFLPASMAAIKPHQGLYVMAAVLMRMGIADEDITMILSKAFESSPLDIGPYFISSVMLRHGVKDCPFVFSFGEKSDGYRICYQITECGDNGRSTICRARYLSAAVEMINPKEEMEYILQYVYK